MRFIVVVLLLAVFFLGGTVFGMNQKEEVSVSPKTEEQVAAVEIPEQSSEEKSPEESSVEVDTSADADDNVSEDNIQPVELEGPAGVTQKAASVLEAAVKGFYNLIVGILYELSQLFF
ncbi:hypothetical protein [Ornithinibacillus halophilus]|uniref:Uncharacterized protein n=1 Tax=Ornithinibacillus halophilus TaxID=930117 RepID=A0A1M5DL14_9BACI|nr:hypothetical protein [Ornithinibacillus halophilus]SHF67708.1 hypothetical protein SAMN05216225_1002113 [Ornithinibacillus halophilus]